jgi:hypothetical protein
MSKETTKQQTAPSRKSLETGKQRTTELTEGELDQVSGGKHIAGVKYEDISVAREK